MKFLPLLLLAGAAPAGAPFSTHSNWHFEGSEMGERLGHKANWAGDLNGDGFADLVVGAAGHGSERGRALVFFGSEKGLKSRPDWEALGEKQGDSFGEVVGAAGDLNGDGYGDFYVDAVNHAGRGKLYVYAGGPKISLLWSAVGGSPAENFGDCAAPAGDLNGDGYGDLAVGAFGYLSHTGRVDVFYGGPRGPGPKADWSFRGPKPGGQLGYGLGPAGDVNGDGYDDLAFSAKALGKGHAYVFHGSAKGLGPKPDWSAQGEEEGAYFGQKIDSAGDLNGDGYGDLLLGASNHARRQGKAYVHLGGAKGLAKKAAWALAGERPGIELGYSGAAAGDLNFDGYGDLVLGAVALGRARLFFGGPQGLEREPAWEARAAKPFDCFASGLASAGDLNGDGAPDLAVSSEAHSGSLERQGRVDVFYGLPPKRASCGHFEVRLAAPGRAWGQPFRAKGSRPADLLKRGAIPAPAGAWRWQYRFKAKPSCGGKDSPWITPALSRLSGGATLRGR